MRGLIVVSLLAIAIIAILAVLSVKKFLKEKEIECVCELHRFFATSTFKLILEFDYRNTVF